MKKIYFFFLLSVFTFCYVVKADNGVPERGIQISPTKFSFEIKPGEEQKAVINVKNYDKNFSHDIEVQIEDFYVEDETSNVQYFTPQENDKLKVYDIINWIEVEKSFTLSPNESKNVEFKIKVPENMPTGGYYGAILFKTSEKNRNKDNADSSNIDESYRASVLLNLVVLGNEPVKLEGKLLRFFSKNRIFFGNSISPKFSLKEIFLDWGGSGNLITHIKNDGNIHFKMKGEIEIYKFGNYYKTIELSENFIYPDKIRVFNNKFDFSWYDFGIYKAKVKLKSVDDKINFEGDSGYWIIFPWKTFFGVILFLVANYFERKWILKRNKQKSNYF